MKMSRVANMVNYMLAQEDGKLIEKKQLVYTGSTGSSKSMLKAYKENPALVMKIDYEGSETFPKDITKAMLQLFSQKVIVYGSSDKKLGVVLHKHVINSDEIYFTYIISFIISFFFLSEKITVERLLKYTPDEYFFHTDFIINYLNEKRYLIFKPNKEFHIIEEWNKKFYKNSSIFKNEGLKLQPIVLYQFKKNGSKISRESDEQILKKKKLEKKGIYEEITAKDKIFLIKKNKVYNTFENLNIQNKEYQLNNNYSYEKCTFKNVTFSDKYIKNSGFNSCVFEDVVFDTIILYRVSFVSCTITDIEIKNSFVIIDNTGIKKELTKSFILGESN